MRDEIVNGELDEDSPLWLVNEQIKGLLEGEGADEDHADVLTFLRSTGLPENTVSRIHRAIVHGDAKATAPEGWELLPQDFRTHVGDFEHAIRIAHYYAAKDDKLYWLHQLKTIVSLRESLESPPAPATGDGQP